MLHIANGGATAEKLRSAHLPGTIRIFDEILMEGPSRDGLATEEDRTLRAARLEQDFGIPREELLSRSAETLVCLEAAIEHDDEVVLWSEEDLFCQVNLAYVLHRVVPRRSRRLTVVSPAEGAVSVLSPETLVHLFQERQDVSPARATLASSFWVAWCLAAPTGLHQLLSEDFGAWPALHQGVRAQLERFPSTFNGLNRIEQALLGALADGPREFPSLFAEIRADAALAGLGVGDLQVAAYLAGLAGGANALLRNDGDTTALVGPAAGDSIGTWRPGVTSQGRRVLEGADDAVRLRGIDRWLGGVHLLGKGPVWRWNAARGEILES